MTFDTHEQVIECYFSKLGIKSIDDLNDQNSFLIIKSAYHDFKNEKLSFDDFSTLGEFLFNKLEPKLTSNSFGAVLLDIAELSDFVRENDRFLNLTDTLKKLQSYFE